MGYVDEADRLLSTYKIDRRSKKWWFRIFWHFLDVVVANSFILYKTKGIKPSLSLKQFRLALVNQLVGEKLPAKKGRKRKSLDTNTYKPQVSLETRRSQSSHMPVHTNDSRRCAHCSTKEKQCRSN